ncbi:LysR family transcriptional regulator [Roseibium sp.]|uniref:LysR family transcriptional regulator n=1 Tax=Roseibium sp. TaxID=1936156 RepID=UPI003D0C30BD
MDTRFLQSLLAVVDTGSIAAAARLQGLTAAAVSQRIRVLEAELDCELLNRSAHAAVPTEACLRLLSPARKLVRDAARLSAEADPDGLRGPFRLGAVSTALHESVPALIRTFREKAPNAELTIRPGTSLSLYEGLLAGDLNAAITVEPPFALPKGIVSELLVTQAIVHISPGDLSRQDTRENALPWIVYDRTSWGGRLIWEACHARIAGGHILCELDALETIALLVAQGVGQAIVPHWRGLTESRLRIGPSGAAGTLSRKLVFLRKNAPASVLGDLALAALRQEA